MLARGRLSADGPGPHLRAAAERMRQAGGGFRGAPVLRVAQGSERSRERASGCGAGSFNRLGMKAIRVHEPGGAEVLRWEDVPMPEAGAGHVVVRVEAAGVNYIDIYKRQGLYRVSLPSTVGEEAAGVVETVGAGVSGFSAGDRVTWVNVLGAYAEYAAVAADRLVRLPGGLTSRQAAAVMLQGMTAHYLATSTYALKAGDTCLVHAAAGGVGLLLCQIAKKRGARVIGTAGSAEKAELARAAGADEVILYRDRDFEAETLSLTGGRGVQVAYDSVGRSTFEASLRCISRRGMMVLYGQSSGPAAALDPQVLNQRGSLFLTRPTLMHYVATREELIDSANALFEMVLKGAIKIEVHQTYPLKDAARAHADLEGRRTTGSTVLLP